MSTSLPVSRESEIVYPDTDGRPVAENTRQFKRITILKGVIETLLRDNEYTFVADDLLWDPVRGNPQIRVAPDTMVAFGRPKGHRGSYRQWDEAGIAPFGFTLNLPRPQPGPFFRPPPALPQRPD